MAACLLSHNRSRFLEIARIVYQETRVSRRNLHAVRGGLRCDASVALTGRFAVSGDCPCVEEVPRGAGRGCPVSGWPEPS